MADVTIAMLAAELAELIYERWMSAAEAGLAIEHAAIEAQVTLIDALQRAAVDPAGSAALLRAAVEVLGTMARFALREEFQSALLARARQRAEPRVRRSVARG